MNDIKTILLIGRTGNGKSTLANVIAGTSKFTEGEFAVSETRKVADYLFEHEGKKYRIVDTVGIGDTGMTLDKVLRKLALMSYSVKDGLSQILFVTDGRLAEEAKSTYDLLEKVVFDESIFNYTTVVRTNFAGFWKENRCEEEKNKMINKSGELRELIEKIEKSGNNKIVFVDNPPVDVSGTRAELNKKRRKESREILLTHLNSVCQGEIYKPINLDNLSNSINEYMERKKGLKEKEEKGIIARGKVQLKNRFLNKKITEEMIEHIGGVDSVLGRTIEEKLDKSKKKESKPARWTWWFHEKNEIVKAQEESPAKNQYWSYLKEN